jgi:uncharacterized protein (DUF2252 family)
MLVSPFAFVRGAAPIMASDLGSTPRSGVQVQLCGDAHLSNFGIFGTPERRLVFDVNDFDETSPGPWEWDVKRLAGSIAVAGRERGFSSKERLATVLAAVYEYRMAMRSFAGMNNLEQYRLVHFARKVVGVGSVGTRAWIRAVPGSGYWRSTVPPDQRSAAFGARTVPRSPRVRQRSRPGRRRPTVDTSRK